ncbi:MAG: PadR family transcriptional regulator [Candidatus Aenigmarchaeota archaeon]|nr:PadR family transcriptional regulator [Candidatus Aenigmarchaeota archaeon]
MDPLERLVDKNTKENLWLYVLRILRDSPSHAYTLRKNIDERFGFMPGNVTAYRVLYQLKLRDLVSKNKEGRKKVYSITPKGIETLKKAVEFFDERTEMLK